ncbi:hypothetical protein I7I50_10640 [Histoplasma capsulatum G186AR]|uniref:Secreted protein n=1 Tax=Ajellomyces capsulatus TaxID=5037 RepID=A0A8H8D6T6_AJECA|nr:hypothetical protein I7I52_01878 [Histoplasma capsulatum]QSS69363.1 hypothetical protein I7I50_10640 [Histoplasma capsulatum G186AR]
MVRSLSGESRVLMAIVLALVTWICSSTNAFPFLTSCCPKDMVAVPWTNISRYPKMRSAASVPAERISHFCSLLQVLIQIDLL